ncbi:hypothetical protein ABB37_06391 [Leptomonas pyrrhocoris]|uniref:Uncharacterized protein n=1 Tax=Leptomonas pyrrhocoris TaxID=157538 RepID=A0A0M9FXQ4_LEPPY|nr:hypothetical protein ABB37_06391 [Leptomonas pyrrhocoris]XP_015656675.1 hypothetical protein ABB37_06391 [Leptomonas pyrrhocoris]KPA78235.1 hypothetical protein ABB37_06391 [Leptomonas pyrrhocoris]KPA78236.1 hypothetical protein ABB37_06391 [Leptomonas pyrrhocoris]|eukprot:XP_015656674.1 hypothetical protein ABB37_06391 [Leptomonas pyrrhocoris]
MGNQNSSSGHRTDSAPQRARDGVLRDTLPPTHLDRSAPPSATARRGRSVSSARDSRSRQRRTASPSVSPTPHFSETASGATAGAATTTTAAPPGRFGSHYPSVSSLTAAAALNAQLTNSTPEHQALQRQNEGDYEGNDEASLRASRSAHSMSQVSSSKQMPNAPCMHADEAPSGLTAETGAVTMPADSDAAAQHVLDPVPTTTQGAAAGGNAEQSAGSLNYSSQRANTAAAAETSPSSRIARSSPQAGIPAPRTAATEAKRTRSRPHSPSPEARPPTPGNAEGKSRSKTTKTTKNEGSGRTIEADSTSPPLPRLPKRSGGILGGVFNPRSSKFLFRKSPSTSPAAREGAPKRAKTDAAPSPVPTGDSDTHPAAAAAAEQSRDGDIGAGQQRGAHREKDGEKTNGSEVSCPVHAPVVAATLEGRPAAVDMPQRSSALKRFAQDKESAAPVGAASPASRSTDGNSNVAAAASSDTTPDNHPRGGGLLGGAVVSLLLPAETSVTHSFDASQLMTADTRRHYANVVRQQGSAAAATAPVQTLEDAEETEETEARCVEVLLTMHSLNEEGAAAAVGAVNPHDALTSPTVDHTRDGTGSPRWGRAAFINDDEEGEEQAGTTAPTVVEPSRGAQQPPQDPEKHRGCPDREERSRSCGSSDDEDSHSTTSTDTNSAPILPPPPTASFAEAMWGIRAAAANAEHSRNGGADQPTAAAAAAAAALSASGSSTGCNSSPIYSPRTYVPRRGRNGALSGATTVITDTTTRVVSPRSPYASSPPYFTGPTGGSKSPSPAHLTTATTEADARTPRRKSVSQSAIIAAWNRLGARSGSLAALPASSMSTWNGKPNGNTKIQVHNNGPVEASTGAAASASAAAMTDGARGAVTAPEELADASNEFAQGSPSNRRVLAESPPLQPTEKASNKEAAPPESTGGGAGTRGNTASLPHTHTSTSTDHEAPVRPVRRRSVLTRQRGHPLLFPPPPSPPLSPTDREGAQHQAERPPSFEGADLHAAVLPEVMEAAPPAAAPPSSLPERGELPSIKGGAARNAAGGLGNGEQAESSGDAVGQEDACVAVAEEAKSGAAAGAKTASTQTTARADNTKPAGRREVAEETRHENHAAHEAWPSRAFTVPCVHVDREAATPHSRGLSGIAEFSEESESSTSATIHIPPTAAGGATVDDRLYRTEIRTGTARAQGVGEEGEGEGEWFAQRPSEAASRQSSRLPSRRPSAAGELSLAQPTKAASSASAVPLKPPSPQARRSLSGVLPRAEAASSSQRHHRHQQRNRLLHNQITTDLGLVWSGPSSPRSPEVAAPFSDPQHRYARQRTADAEDGGKDEEGGGESDKNARGPEENQCDADAAAAATAAALAAASTPLLSEDQQRPQDFSTTAVATAASHAESNNKINYNNSSTSYPYQRLASPPTLAGASLSGSIGSTGPVVAAAAAAGVFPSSAVQSTQAYTRQRQTPPPPQQQQPLSLSSILSARATPYWREQLTPAHTQPISPRSFSATRDDDGDGGGGGDQHSTNHNNTSANTISGGGGESGDYDLPAGARRRRLNTASQATPPLAQHPSSPQQLYRALSGSGVQWREVSPLASAAVTPNVGTAGPGCGGQEEDEEEEEEEAELQDYRPRHRYSYRHHGARQATGNAGGDDKVQDEAGRTEAGELQRARQHQDNRGGDDPLRPRSDARSPVSWIEELPQPWQRDDDEDKDNEEDGRKEEGNYRGAVRGNDDNGEQPRATRQHLHDEVPHETFRGEEDANGAHGVDGGGHGPYRCFSPRGIPRPRRRSAAPESNCLCTPPEEKSPHDGARHPFQASPSSGGPDSASRLPLPLPRYEPPMPSNKNTFTAFVSLSDIPSAHLLTSATAVFHGRHPHGDSGESSSGRSSSRSSGNRPSCAAAADGSGEMSTSVTTPTNGNGFSTVDTPVTADTLLTNGHSPLAVHQPIGAPSGGGGGMEAAPSSAPRNSSLFSSSSASTALTESISGGDTPVQHSPARVTRSTSPHRSGAGKGRGGDSDREGDPTAAQQAGNGDDKPVLPPRQQQSGMGAGGVLSNTALPQNRKSSAAAAVAAAAAPIIARPHQQTSPRRGKYTPADEAASTLPTNCTQALSPTDAIVRQMAKTHGVVPTPTTTAATTTTSATITTSASVITSSGSALVSAVAADRHRRSSCFQSSMNEAADASNGDIRDGMAVFVEREDTTQHSSESDTDVGVRRHASATVLTAQLLTPLSTAMVRTNSEPILAFQLHRSSVLNPSRSPEQPWWNRSRLARSEGSGLPAELGATPRGTGDGTRSHSIHMRNSSSRSLSDSPLRLFPTWAQPDEVEEGDDGAMGRDAELPFAMTPDGKSEGYSALRDDGEDEHSFYRKDEEEDAEDADSHHEGGRRREGRASTDAAVDPLLHIRRAESLDIGEEHGSADEDEAQLVGTGLFTATWHPYSPLSSSFSHETELTSPPAAAAAAVTATATGRVSRFTPIAKELASRRGSRPAFTVVVPPTSSFLEEAILDASKRSEDENESEEKTPADALGAEEQAEGDRRSSGNSSSAATASAFVARLDNLIDTETYTRACVQESAEDVLGTWQSVWSAVQQQTASSTALIPASTTSSPLQPSTTGEGREGEEDGPQAHYVASLSSPTASDAPIRRTSALLPPSSAVPPPLSVSMLMSVIAPAITATTSMKSNASGRTLNTTVVRDGDVDDEGGGGQAGEVDAAAAVFSEGTPLGEECEVSVPAAEGRHDSHRRLMSPPSALAVAEDDAAAHQDSAGVENWESSEPDEAASPSTLVPAAEAAAEGPRRHAKVVVPSSRYASTVATPNAQHIGQLETPSYVLFGPSTTSGVTLNNTLSPHSEDADKQVEEEEDETWGSAEAAATDTAGTKGHVSAEDTPQAVAQSGQQQQQQQRIAGEDVEEDQANRQLTSSNGEVNREEKQQGGTVSAKFALPPAPSSSPSGNTDSATLLQPTTDASPHTRQGSPDPLPPQVLAKAPRNDKGSSTNVKAPPAALVPPPSNEEEGKDRIKNISSNSNHPHHASTAPPTSPSPQAPPRLPSSPAQHSYSSQRRPSMGQVVCRWCGAPYTSAVVCPVAGRAHQLLREERKREKMAKRQAQALLCAGRITEAVALLKQTGLYVP